MTEKKVLTKSEFVGIYAQKADISKKIAKENLEKVLATISEVMNEINELRFFKFGVFRAKEVDGRVVKTPKGKNVDVPSHRQLSFSAGVNLKKAINTKAAL